MRFLPLTPLKISASKRLDFETVLSWTARNVARTYLWPQSASKSGGPSRCAVASEPLPFFPFSTSFTARALLTIARHQHIWLPSRRNASRSRRASKPPTTFCRSPPCTGTRTPSFAGTSSLLASNPSRGIPS